MVNGYKQEKAMTPEEKKILELKGKLEADPNAATKIKELLLKNKSNLKLWNRFDDEVTPSLQKMLSNKDPNEVRAAAKTLASTSRGVRTLEAMVIRDGDKKEREKHVKQMIWALAEVGSEEKEWEIGKKASKETVRVLNDFVLTESKLFTENNARVCYFAMEALANLALTARKNESTKEIADMAIASLKSIADASAEPAAEDFIAGDRNSRNIMTNVLATAYRSRIWHTEHKELNDAYSKETNIQDMKRLISEIIDKQNEFPVFWAGYTKRRLITNEKDKNDLRNYASQANVAMYYPLKEVTAESTIQFDVVGAQAPGEIVFPDQLMRKVSKDAVNDLYKAGVSTERMEAIGAIAAKATKGLAKQKDNILINISKLPLDESIEDVRATAEKALKEGALNTYNTTAAVAAATALKQTESIGLLEQLVRRENLDFEVKVASLDSLVSVLEAREKKTKPTADYLAELYIESPKLQSTLIGKFGDVGDENAAKHMDMLVNKVLTLKVPKRGTKELESKEYEETDKDHLNALIRGLGSIRNERAVQALVNTAITNEDMELRDAASQVIADMRQQAERQGDSALVSTADAVVPILLKKIQASDGIEEKERAILLVAEFGDNRARDDVLNGLSDPDAMIRRASAKAAGNRMIVKIGDKEAIDKLMQLAVRNKEGAVREAALESLAVIGNGKKELAEKMQPLFKDRDAGVRGAAIKASLGIHSTASSVKLATEALNDESEDVVIAASAALMKVNASNSKEIGLSLADMALSPRKDEEIRQKALDALAVVNIPNAELAEKIRELLFEPKYPEIRASAVKAFAALSSPFAPEVYSMMADTNADVRAATVEVILARASAPTDKEARDVRKARSETVKSLITLARDKKEQESTRIVALKAIANIGAREEDLLAKLTPSLRDERPAIREAVVVAIGTSKEQRMNIETVKVMANAVEDRDNAVRNLAASVLGQIKTEANEAKGKKKEELLAELDKYSKK